jgi:hypothetical protein
MKLVTFQKDWADEFYVFGWKLFTDEGWADYLDMIDQHDTWNLHFGTNEAFEDESSADLLKYDLEVKDLSEEEGIVIKAAFGTDEFGVFPTDECFLPEEE